MSNLIKTPRLLRRLVVGGGLLLATSVSIAGMTQGHAQAREFDRTKLPIAEPRPEKVTKVLPSEVPLPPQWEVTAPAGAPNVVIILLDDVGYAAPSAFGGVVNMPTAERLAQDGLRYNRFHTTALCAPTRAALKSGRNHHKVNTGSIPEVATGYAGNSTVVPDYAIPVAEILRLNGYNTAAFGKWHETPGRETTAAGPQTRWPTRQGFEKFYGFVGAEDNMWEPTIHDGVTIVDAPKKDRYHFTEDMTDQAIGWVRQQKAIKPDKPFFIYYSSAGAHSRTMWVRNGLPNTAASSMKVGMFCGHAIWRIRSRRGLSLLERRWRRLQTVFPNGIPSRPNSSESMPVRQKCLPPSPSILITKQGV